MSIDSLDDLRPGDIMLATQNAAPARVIVDVGEWLLEEGFTIGDFSVGHAAIVVPGNRIVEAMPRGARIRPITSDDWGPHTAFIRLPEDYKGQSLDAAVAAMAMIGTPYSIWSYVYLAFYLSGFKPKWLAKRINRRLPETMLTLPSGYTISIGLPVEAICSVLVEQAWTFVEKNVIYGTAPQVVTPGLLAFQLWERIGVIKGASWFKR